MATRISDATRAKLDEIWPDILAEVAAGKRYSAITDGHGISYAVLSHYKLSTPGAREQWEQARKDSAGALVDRMLDIANNTDPDSDPARVRAQLDSLKFLIEKLDPERYSPRTRAEITHKMIDLTSIIKDAQHRLAAAREGRLIEGQATRVADALALPAELAALL